MADAATAGADELTEFQKKIVDSFATVRELARGHNVTLVLVREAELPRMGFLSSLSVANATLVMREWMLRVRTGQRCLLGGAKVSAKLLKQLMNALEQTLRDGFGIVILFGTPGESAALCSYRASHETFCNALEKVINEHQTRAGN